MNVFFFCVILVAHALFWPVLCVLAFTWILYELNN